MQPQGGGGARARGACLCGGGGGALSRQWLLGVVGAPLHSTYPAEASLSSAWMQLVCIPLLLLIASPRCLQAALYVCEAFPLHCDALGMW